MSIKDCDVVRAVNYTQWNRPPRLAYSYNVDGGRTKQEFKDECDINIIVRNFVKHGALSPRDINARTAMYEDVSGIGDLQSSMSKVEAAKAGFERLPAAVRERFGNSAVALLRFVLDPANRAEAIELGLIDGPAPVVPAVVADGKPAA